MGACFGRPHEVDGLENGRWELRLAAVASLGPYRVFVFSGDWNDDA